jgi:hypothetical protein
LQTGVAFTKRLDVRSLLVKFLEHALKTSSAREGVAPIRDGTDRMTNHADLITTKSSFRGALMAPV